MWDRSHIKGFQAGLYFAQNELQIASETAPVSCTATERDSNVITNISHYLLIQANNKRVESIIRRHEIELGRKRSQFDAMTQCKVTDEIIKELGWEKYNV